MANVNKVSFAVRVTPKVQMDNVNGVTVARDVFHEEIRRNLSGSGEITGNDVIIDDQNNDGDSNGGWNNGVFTAVTSDGTEYAVSTGNNLIFFKHTGLLFGTTTASAAADTVKIGIHGDDTTNVEGDGVKIATLANGEAFLLPRPASTLTWKLTSVTSNHVGVEVLSVGT